MGFDENRFINEVEEEFKCPICHDVMEDPTVSQCEHIFCKLCIDEWLQINSTCPFDKKPLIKSQLCEPSRFFRNFYFRLELKCSYNSNGCEKICKIEDLNSHQKECEFNPNAKYECNKGCGASMKRNEAINHNCVEYLKNINQNLKAENINQNLKTENMIQNLKAENEIIFKRELHYENMIRDLETMLSHFFLNLSNNLGEIDLSSLASALTLRRQQFALSIAENGHDVSGFRSRPSNPIYNSSGDIVRKGNRGPGGDMILNSSQLFYCGRRKNECRCGVCNGICGPDNGCPCEACLKLIRNSDGDLVWKGKIGSCGDTGLLPSQLFYCGRRKNECRCGVCDGICGPNDGCPCEACLKLIRNSDGDLVWKGKTGTGGDTGLPPSLLLYCGRRKNQCRCGRCDGRCGPDNGCPCEACLKFVM